MSDEMRAMKPAHIIVLGNEKGGSGKTTTAMHIIAHLLHAGYRVGSIDLDGRQRSLTRYVENRKAWADAANVNLVMPDHAVIVRSTLGTVSEANAAEEAELAGTISRLSSANDYLVIDCPGSDNNLSRLGHAHADTLITPMNDSFVDFDLLGRVDPQSYKVLGPSVYSEMVWECRKRRAVSDGGEIDWIVVRNRLSHVDAKNKRRVEAVLETLARRIGFRTGPGFGERVIFREMFPSGLTLLDLREEGVDTQMSMSHVAARAEVRALAEALNLPVVA
ncbi:MAG: ATPase [Parvibaculum sp.]|jgi:chromosome partitioning protein|uniref:division plane positioning ATPase MipZ n=2 Tax=Parvibaculum sp. TaxID=2024848 RepID=UPI000C5F0E7B|nr:division plane positioning ATPase MipZ [Parvibaculum sp.]MAU59238.1 ATPase [Parvibaculum sp.]HAC58365.1 ATPase [Rhodobiaceae bacterium]|tara:strand:+ start:8370 stop:9200 length:831 start_codon:yes stop_codon:yes gene_type:complete